jgi:hypothetical protein
VAGGEGEGEGEGEGRWVLGGGGRTLEGDELVFAVSTPFIISHSVLVFFKLPFLVYGHHSHCWAEHTLHLSRQSMLQPWEAQRWNRWPWSVVTGPGVLGPQTVLSLQAATACLSFQPQEEPLRTVRSGQLELAPQSPGESGAWQPVLEPGGI